MQDLTAVDLLKMFGIEPDEVGAVLWLELVERIRAEPACNMREIMREMCKKYRSSLKFLYGTMKGALLPLLTADDDFLRALGFSPRKRTTSEFAQQAAQIFSE